MKLICTRIRQSLSVGKLSGSLCICKFRELQDGDYQQMFQAANGWGHTDNTRKSFVPSMWNTTSFSVWSKSSDCILKTFAWKNWIIQILHVYVYLLIHFYCILLLDLYLWSMQKVLKNRSFLKNIVLKDVRRIFLQWFYFW